MPCRTVCRKIRLRAENKSLHTPPHPTPPHPTPPHPTPPHPTPPHTAAHPTPSGSRAYLISRVDPSQCACVRVACTKSATPHPGRCERTATNRPRAGCSARAREATLPARGIAFCGAQAGAGGVPGRACGVPAATGGAAIGGAAARPSFRAHARARTHLLLLLLRRRVPAVLCTPRATSTHATFFRACCRHAAGPQRPLRSTYVQMWFACVAAVAGAIPLGSACSLPQGTPPTPPTHPYKRVTHILPPRPALPLPLPLPSPQPTMRCIRKVHSPGAACTT